MTIQSTLDSLQQWCSWFRDHWNCSRAYRITYRSMDCYGRDCIPPHVVIDFEGAKLGGWGPKYEYFGVKFVALYPGSMVKSVGSRKKRRKVQEIQFRYIQATYPNKFRFRKGSTRDINPRRSGNQSDRVLDSWWIRNLRSRICSIPSNIMEVS